MRQRPKPAPAPAPAPKPTGQALQRLAEEAGILTSYYDIKGTLHTASDESLLKALVAMGHTDPAESVPKLKLRPWYRLLEPVLVARAGQDPITAYLRLPLDPGREDRVLVEIDLSGEHGQIEARQMEGLVPVETLEIEGVRHVRAELHFDLGPGYYRLEATCSTITKGRRKKLKSTMCIIVSPGRCHLPEGLRTWGLTANLYALRSDANYGIGDLGDLGRLLRWADTELQAGFIGLSPLHTIANDSLGCPYYPLSRLYHNPIYIDMHALPGGKKVKPGPEVREELAKLRSAYLIDYPAVWALKSQLLRECYKEFLRTEFKAGEPHSEEAREFEAYVKYEGETLKRYAAFMALRESFKGKPWQEWPKKYHDPEGKSVAEFVKAHKAEVQFQKFLQWVMHRQLGALSRYATEHMPLGLYADLAVGTAAEGSDAWTFSGVFAEGMTVGAPPDDFSPLGQNWGFPPMLPDRLRESGYEAFIETMRKNMHHASVLRIDHALGLFRLFWIPEGAHASEGVYVTYHYEEMLAILALESTRSKTVVIAEDLGTIGDNVREALDRYALLSYRLFYFERDWGVNRFLSPQEYPAQAVCAVNTHDLPTLAGYWAGRDIEVKRELGIYGSDADWKADLETRGRDRQSMLDALRHELPEGYPRDARALPALDRELWGAVHRHLGATPCSLMAVSLDDLLGSMDQQNFPGITHSYPNWQRKYPHSLEELREPGSSALALGKGLTEKFSTAPFRRVKPMV